MQLRVVTDQPWDVPADVLVVPVAATPAFDGPLGELDRRAGGELQAPRTRSASCRGSATPRPSRPAARRAAGRLLTVGVGEPRDRRPRGRPSGSRPPAERRLGGRDGRIASRSGSTPSPTPWTAARGRRRAGRARRRRGLVRPADDLPRRRSKRRRRPSTSSILVAPGADVGALERAAERGLIIGEGAKIARTLSNRASNDVSPEVLADEARAIAERHGLWIDVIGPEQADRAGHGHVHGRRARQRQPAADDRHALGRRRASATRSAGTSRIVGKGVCFDSGGISIKPAGRMEEMKMDKTGACTVICGHRHGRPARARHAAPRRRAGRREHARPALDAARRHRHARSTARWSTSPTPTPRAGSSSATRMTYARAARGDAHRGRRDADGRRRRGRSATSCTGAFGTPQAWYDEVMAAGGAGPASATGSCRSSTTTCADDGQLVRRHHQLGHAGGLARQERRSSCASS